MSTKQRLLFITTGGTIASVRTQQGLKPVLTSEELLAHLPELTSAAPTRWPCAASTAPTSARSTG